jgi:16S rRNA (guanine527-N7)-methyltransferase
VEDRLRGLDIPLGKAQIGQLAKLDDLLEEWGKAVDLAGFRDREERFHRYLAEPLDAYRWLPDRAGPALDIGSGGGSPALPLAVARPGDHWTLLEPNRRRAVFLEEALSILGLKGSRVVRRRWEDFVPDVSFLTITSRGVALPASSLPTFADWLEPAGRLLLFTGQERSEELVQWGVDIPRLSLKAQIALAPQFKAWLVVFERRETS